MRNLFALALLGLASFTAELAEADQVNTVNTLNHLTVFQQAATASATALPAYGLSNGLYCSAKAGNTASIEVGGSTVTTTVNGTGNGVIVAAGYPPVFFPVNNSGLLYIIGTAGDVISCWGN